MNEQRQQELLKIVERNYEDIARDFDTTRKKVLWPTLIEFSAMVASDQSILDVGCGNGRLLRAFESGTVDYVGIDNSNNLIELAIKNVENLENVQQRLQSRFLVGDILDLGQLNLGLFDWVFSIAVIHHLPSFELRVKALKNLKLKLAPGGKIVLSVWRPWGNKRLIKELFKALGSKLIGRHRYAWNDLVFVWKNNQSPRYYHFFTKYELRRLAREAGLKIVDFRAEQRNYYLVLK
jgi:SAM-dependent methyltransferase